MEVSGVPDEFEEQQTLAAVNIKGSRACAWTHLLTRRIFKSLPPRKSRELVCYAKPIFTLQFNIIGSDGSS